MDFIKETFKYLRKSFIPLCVVAALPAVMMGVFMRPFSSVSFLPFYYTLGAANFSTIFWMMMTGRIELSGILLSFVIPLILIVPVLMLGIGYGLGMIEKQFKTGKLGLTNPWRAINNSILSIIKTVPIFLVLLLLVLLTQTGILTLIRTWTSGLDSVTLLGDAIAVSIVSGLFFLIKIMLLIIFGVWAVIIQIYGYSFTDAFIEAIRTISKQWLALVLGLIVPVAVLIVPQIVYNMLPMFWYWLQMSISILSHLLIIVYYMAYITVSVYKINGLERRDNKPAYIRGFR